MFDPDKVATPIYVGIGLVIAQLFIYGKKIKSRLTISVPELVGDLMQFGVKYAISVATIQLAIRLQIFKSVDLWQGVGITIIIITSFDTYFDRVKRVVMERFFGAVAAIFGKLPVDTIIGVPAGRGAPASVDIDVDIANDGSDVQTKAGIPMRKAFPTDPKSAENIEMVRDLDKKLSNS